MRYSLVILSIIFFIASCTLKKPALRNSVYKEVGPFLYYYEGVQNRLYGNPLASITHLKRSLTLNPNNSAVYYELALNYATLNDYDLALKNIQKSVELEPYNSYYRSFASIVLISKGLYEHALQNQIFLVELTPNNFSNKYQLALLYSENGDFENALSILNQLESSLGVDPRISETKARIFLSINDFEKADEQIDILLEIDPSNPINYLYKGDILFRQGKDSLAFQQIIYAKSLDPNQIFPTIELYKRYLDSGRRKEAIDLLVTIISEESLEAQEKVSLYYPLLFDQVSYTTYVNQLDSIVTNLIALHNTIEVNDLAFEHFIRVRDLDKARSSLNNLTKLDAQNPARLEKLISFDYSLNNRNTAFENTVIAINTFPEEYVFYVFNALILEEKGDIYEAIKILNKGTAKVKDNNSISELYGMIGDYYYKQGDNKNAFKSYNKGLKFNSKNARILNNYSYYLALSSTKRAKALEMSSKAVELEPNNSTYIDTKGWVLFVMGRYEEARDVLRNAIAKSGSTSAVINEHYGDALYLTGNKENAYIYWLKAKEIGGGSEVLDEKIRTKTYVP